jgi:hypothetical protein
MNLATNQRPSDATEPTFVCAIWITSFSCSGRIIGACRPPKPRATILPLAGPFGHPVLARRRRVRHANGECP